ncbi:NERD domain-containing protein [Methylomonas sp. BW4-1]|uniref:NERD domain-containing protein n=1 Tax=Methylomonas sp. BW4-1 TaxID=3376685 RepID=UPI0040437404
MDIDKRPLSEDLPMSIDDARKIMWLRSNPRPVGELLDEGYLNEARLRWAAEKAYAPELKLAAGVLLQSLGKAEKIPEIRPTSFSSNSFPIKISLDQARNTIWPFHPYKDKLMGWLLDTKQLTLKDLGYAIENAWDERVRQAAITLNLVELKQTLETPVSSAGFLNVVESKERNYSERRQLAFSFLQGAILGAILAGCIALVVYIFSQRPPAQAISKLAAIPSGWGILMLAIAVLLGWGGAKLCIFCLDWIIERLEKQINNHRLGQEGENNVVDRMRHLLDGNWYLFRNIVLPGQNKSDIDAVLVGPSGLWALEVKTFNGQYRVIGDEWRYKKNQTWKPVKSDPTRQAVNNAKRLSDFISNNSQIKVWVTPVVVWANPESTLTVQNSTVNIWRLEQLADEIGNLWGSQKVSDADQKKLIDKLRQLCVNQLENVRR